jgi:hypothetical protein
MPEKIKTVTTTRDYVLLNSRSVNEICTDDNALQFAKKCAKLYNPESVWVLDVAETEDGYEQVGVYDPETKTIKPVEESEDEGVEVEDFEYKGKTYQRDAENNVYLDGEQVGSWNGKKIVPN